MCIAIIKPSGKPLPKREWIENGFDNNPDGAGFAVKKQGSNEIIYEKGYFDPDEYYQVLLDNINVEDEALIHMRITTHGGTSAECCHPFPLTSHVTKMRKTKGITDNVLIHNGVLGGRFGNEAKHGVSDTMVLTKYIAMSNIKQGKALKVMLKHILGGNNKVAMLSDKGILRAGEGWKLEKDGNWYSNNTYSYGGWDCYGYGWNTNRITTPKSTKKGGFSFKKSKKDVRRRHVTTLSMQDQLDLSNGICPECLMYMPDALYKDYYCDHCKVEFV